MGIRSRMLIGNSPCEPLVLDGLNTLNSQIKSCSSIKYILSGFSGGAGAG